ncbi:hypothetical protein BH10ACI3_BH10ACI3_12070 [soil metagenome]
MSKLIIIAAVTIICLQNFYGQQPRVLGERSGCDITQAELDTVLTEFKAKNEELSYLIIIGRASKSEKQIYNDRRLSTIAKYFVSNGVDLNKVISATAKGSEKYGSVEIYVDGRLSLTLKSPARGDFCTYCCEAPDVKKQISSRKEVLRSVSQFSINKSNVRAMGSSFTQTLGYDAFSNLTSRTTQTYSLSQVGFTASYANNRDSMDGYDAKEEWGQKEEWGHERGMGSGFRCCNTQSVKAFCGRWVRRSHRRWSMTHLTI